MKGCGDDDEKIQQQLGPPEEHDGRASLDDDPLIPGALISPASFEKVDSKYFSDQLVLLDFGESYLASCKPTKQVETRVQYRAPETIFNQSTSKASDIWALACSIFELRAGTALFECSQIYTDVSMTQDSLADNEKQMLKSMAYCLGMPHELLSCFRARLGPDIVDDVKSALQEGTTSGYGDDDDELSLIERIKKVGMGDYEFFSSTTSLSESERRPYEFLEPLKLGISNREADDFAALLRPALRYKPEERLSARDMLDHPWLQRGQE